ncbi:DNA gyrase subunit A [Negativibacillus massiliensis]|uniref:DNA gyrase subunit A n=1 Tax=Negativibacillus massiliensis TaxID=1871035 RepID=UPI00033B71BC|nr:DNA gyrase subunit A [Negativibacillus massiliensis]MDY4048313.1 DNA gyrase subunit A [Negativibacillus massiliensis]CDA76006.1 dNA gyrase subunit A [Clostridium sp. CAG:242]
MNTSGENLILKDIASEMKDAYLDYSMSVIAARALPDVRDGLKPVHRRILYTMYGNGLYPEKPFRKCADTVGNVLGQYHPHGDASVYDALVRMAQDFSLRYPLVHGHGNFGSVDGDPPAAYRYTESKMSKISMRMLTDIDKETVDFMPNYDDRLQEPVVLPSRFPNLLVNGSTGIAVGMATNIPPHNLGEVIDGACCLLDNPNAGLDQLMEHIKGPDFPTGGIIMGRSGIRAAYATGRGKIILRAKTHIEQHKNGRERIIVTEIPYMVNKARLIERIADLVKEKKVDQISNIRDESSRKGMKIVIELKRDANAQIVLNQLYSFTQLQDTVGVTMLALVKGEPKTLSLKQMLEEYIKFQEEIITRRTIFDLKKAKERAHILEGLLTALDYIDEVISIIRSHYTVQEGKAALMERFGLDDVQAQAIVQMPLGRLAGLEREKIQTEVDELHAKIAEYNAILADEQKIRAIVKEELLEIKEKFNDPRRTELATIEGEVDIEDLIPEESCVVTLTRFGYLKRQPLDVYKTQRRGGRGISGMTRRDEDFVSDIYTCSTHDYLMFFTNKGKVYRIKGYEIPEGSRTSRGTNVVNILPLEQNEKITCVIKTSDIAAENKYYVMVTRNGIIKRTEYNAYINVRKSGLIAINLDEGDELAWVKITNGSDDLILATRNGMSIRFNEEDARSMGRTARGVKAIALDEGDQVVGMVVAEEGKDILTVSQSGLGRRTDVSEYRIQTRGGKGLRNYYCDKNGPVAGFEKVDSENDIILITDSAIIIRIPVDQISKQSRYAGGVKVMRVDEETSIIGIAAVEKEEESEQDGDSSSENELSAQTDETVETADLPQPDPEKEQEQISRLLDAAMQEEE